MIKNIILCIAIWLMAMPLSTQAQEDFPYPSVPIELTAPEERADFVIRHYWDNIDFNDTTLIHQSKSLEQGFVNFIDLLPRLPHLEKVGLQTFCRKAFGNNAAYDKYLKQLAEQYLYTPASPMHNDTLYAHLLEELNTLPSTTEAEREQNRFLITGLNKNKVGDVATDFEYTDAQGKMQRLSEAHTPYIIVYFYDPDCETCQEVEKQMAQEPLLKESASAYENQNRPSDSNKITLIKVNAMERKELWKDYYFRSFPTLYLLDKDKKVVLKDVELAKIISFLAEHTR